MPDNLKRQALRDSRLGADLNDDECGVLAGVVDLHDLADGDVLVRQGSTDEHLYVVVSGLLGVVRHPDSDNRMTIATLQPGDLAGELGFIDGTERHASLVALGSVRVLGLERTRLESLLSTHPVIVYHVMRAIIRTVHAIQRRLSQQAVELTNYVYKQHGRY